MVRLTILTCVLGMAVGCGDDPVSFSAPVGINLKAKSEDTANGVVSDDKAITTESGNPFGAFITDASNAIGGDPARVEIDSLELFLGANSTGVVTLGEIFDGETEIVFEMNDSNNSFPAGIGVIEPTTSAGPVGLDPEFDSDALADADYDRFLNGSFKVIVRGPAAAEFEGKGADADLQVTLTFAAFE
jgi:hypothetical protein